MILWNSLLSALILCGFSSTSFSLPAPILKNPDFIKQSKCELAIGLSSEKSDGSVTRVLCFRPEIDPSLNNQKVCALRLLDVEKKTELDLSVINPELSGSMLSVPRPLGTCDGVANETLFQLPVTDKLSLIEAIHQSSSLSGTWKSLTTSTKLLSWLMALNTPRTKGREEAVETKARPVQPPADEQNNGDLAGTTPMEHSIVPVYFGTDRKVDILNNQVVVQYDRSAGGALSLGKAMVSIPKSHKFGQLELPSIFSLEFSPNPDKHLVLKSVQKVSYESFYDGLNEDLKNSTDKNLLLFVHGYNVTFEKAIFRTAQIAYDLQFDGPAVLFSWPSEGRIWKYFVDEANVEWAYRHLGYFLMDIVNKTGAKKIHLIAHSMGSRALTNALTWLMNKQVLGTQHTQRIQNLILAAPDLDAGVFQQLSKEIRSSAQQVTLYSSSKDFPLELSLKFHGYPRVGLNQPAVFVSPDLQTIDATKTDTSFLGHSYIGESPSVIRDLIRLLEGNLLAPKRPNLLKKSTSNGAYWELQP